MENAMKKIKQSKFFQIWTNLGPFFPFLWVTGSQIWSNIQTFQQQSYHISIDRKFDTDYGLSNEKDQIFGFFRICANFGSSFPVFLGPGPQVGSKIKTFKKQSYYISIDRKCDADYGKCIEKTKNQDSSRFGPIWGPLSQFFWAPWAPNMVKNPNFSKIDMYMNRSQIQS